MLVSPVAASSSFPFHDHSRSVVVSVDLGTVPEFLRITASRCGCVPMLLFLLGGKRREEISLYCLGNLLRSLRTIIHVSYVAYCPLAI